MCQWCIFFFLYARIIYFILWFYMFHVYILCRRTEQIKHIGTRVMSCLNGCVKRGGGGGGGEGIKIPGKKHRTNKGKVSTH